MAKFTGFMCDVCSTAENGHERPIHWLGVRMPTSSNTDTAEIKDVCSDKCLLKFARERNGGSASTIPRASQSKTPGLSEFLDTRGVKPSAKGRFRQHMHGNAMR